MDNRIVIEGPDGTFGAYIARPTMLGPRRQWSFSKSCLVLTPTFERPATS
jgi:hypothetical protein